jgi:hypothetical protein
MAEWVYKPGSVRVLQPSDASTEVNASTRIKHAGRSFDWGGGYPSTSVRPTREFKRGGPPHPPLFGLAPSEVYPATAVTDGAVSSYLTISPLPQRTGAVYFLWHFLWGRPPWELPSALPYGARTFLTPARKTGRQRVRPTHSAGIAVYEDSSSHTWIAPQCSQYNSSSLRRTLLRACGGNWRKQTPQDPLRTAANRIPGGLRLRS